MTRLLLFTPAAVLAYAFHIGHEAGWTVFAIFCILAAGLLVNDHRHPPLDDQPDYVPDEKYKDTRALADLDFEPWTAWSIDEALDIGNESRIPQQRRGGEWE